MFKIITALLLVTGTAFSQTATMPAARMHVKMVAGNAVKYTSKLTNLVDLNFTMGNTHQPGKQIITAALDRIAKNYGTGTVNAFTIKHIASAQDGSVKGEIPNFTIDDLLACEVIVADNISAFGDASLGAAKQQALQRAVEVEGRGYLGFHGSGDNEAAGWPWYTNTLHPMNYGGHGSRTVGPVYKHLDEAKHIVMQGILETKTTLATVPNELDAGGNEVLAANIPTRGMKNEWYRFGRDISRDAAYKDKVTMLLKYDPRPLGTDALPDQNKRKGGNLYTYLYQVGKGTTSYIPAGHENDELLDPTTGFDGGSGDFDRYVAQSLFYLAGYKTGICDASCNGLPVVDTKNRLTGTNYISSGIIGPMKADLFFDPVKLAFSSPFNRKYEATVTDMAGRVLFMKQGTGKTYQEFPASQLKSGVYFLSVKIGSAKVKVKRYAFLP